MTEGSSFLDERIVSISKMEPGLWAVSIKERGKRDQCNGKVKQRNDMWTNWDAIKAEWCMKQISKWKEQRY